MRAGRNMGRASPAGGSVQADAVVGVPLGHVGEDDAVAGLEAAEDLDGVDGAAAKLDLGSGGFTAIGGETVTTMLEGRERFAVIVRYPRELRDSPDKLASLPVLTPSGQQITLGTVAAVRISDGPPMLRSENGRPVTWIYVDGRERDMQTLVGDISQAIAAASASCSERGKIASRSPQRISVGAWISPSRAR